MSAVSPSSPTGPARFISYVAGVLTVFMLLFPPYATFNGIEYAFLLTGPQWSSQLGVLGAHLGMAPHIHWLQLTAQVALLWAIALGARRHLSPPPAPLLSPMVLGGLMLVTVPGIQAQHRITPDAGSAAFRPVSAPAHKVSLRTASPRAAADSLDTTTVGLQGGRFGLGVTSSWPAYGLSGTMQVSETLTAEALLGFLGTVTNFGGRVWYRFKRDVDYDLYGYGAASLYRYDYVINTESVLGLGGGAGIEAGLQRLFDDADFPPIFINAEVGLAFANFQYYNFSTFIFGAGIHYRFGN